MQNTFNRGEKHTFFGSIWHHLRIAHLHKLHHLVQYQIYQNLEPKKKVIIIIMVIYFIDIFENFTIC